MSNRESILEYAKSLENLVNVLFDVSHNIFENEKLCSLIRGLHQDFGVKAEVIHISEKGFFKAVSQSIIEESTRDDTQAQDKNLAANFYTEKTARLKRDCYKCRKKGFVAKNCSTKMVCSYCKKKCHIATRCWNSLKNCRFREDRYDNSHQKHNLRNEDKQRYNYSKEFVMVLATSAFFVINEETKHKRIYDSNATNNVCNAKESFETFCLQLGWVKVGISEKALPYDHKNVRVSICVNGKAQTVLLNDVIFAPK